MQPNYDTWPAVDPLRYAGFWRRLGALLLDGLILFPISATSMWCFSHYRLFYLYTLLPMTLFGLFFSVYLVRRYGGTPGKLIAGIRIRKVNGDAIGYREAMLRYLPECILGILSSIAMALAILQMSDAEYLGFTFAERARQTLLHAPAWERHVRMIQNVWIWSEFIVMLTNRRRRALHDFIAGTVVVVHQK